MKRAWIGLAALAAACSGSEISQVTLFEASPSTVQRGGTTTLFFSTTGAQSATIDHGVGDVTGKSHVDVTPADTTTYSLIATSKDGVKVEKSVTVTVVDAKASSWKVEAASTATAGETVTVTITALGADGQKLSSFLGTATLTTDDGAATLPHLATFDAAGQGVATVEAIFQTAGRHEIVASDAQASGSAAVAVKNAAASALALEGIPDSPRAGDPVTLRITARDAFGNVAEDFTGAVTLTASDASASLPASVTFVAADHGARNVSLSFATSGAATVTARSGDLVATGSSNVRNAAASHFVISGALTEAIAGDGLTVTFKAMDRFGNLATDYTGTVQVTTSDGTTMEVTFAAADDGVKTSTLNLSAAGAQQLSASDGDGVSGSASLQVKHGVAVAYALSALPRDTVAGTPLALSITALDSKGNVVKSYAGSAHIASREAADQLPADGGFTDGVRTVSVALLTVGVRPLVVSEVGGTITADTNSVTVAAGPARKLVASGANVVAGASNTYTVSAFDAYGNAADAYAGTLNVTSDDSGATLPGPVTASGGTATFDATLVKAGTRKLTVTDASDASITVNIWAKVQAADAASIALSGVPGSVNAGEPASAVVTALDAYGNVATSFTGGVSFSTGDAKATLPAAYAFVAGDQGRHAFGFKLGTVGSWTLQATSGAFDPAQSGSISVAAGAADHVRITGLPSSAHAGDALSATLTVQDRYDNTTSFSGTVHLVLTDLAGSVADAAITAGTGTASPHFATVGKQSLVVSDSTLSGSAELDITPAEAVSYTLAALPSVAVAGEPLTLVATALDSFGNVDTAYSAVAHVAGSTGDELPADTAFTAGRLSVGLSFTRIGSHSVTLSQVSGTLTKTSSTVNVTSDFAVSLSMTPGGGTATAGAGASFTLSANDRFANLVSTYAGTVDFTSSDAAFVSPGATSFSGSGGTRTLSVTFKTAATERLDAKDTATSSIAGGAAWTVVPGPAASCVIDQQPSVTNAGTPIGFRVTLSDAFANKARNYAGTIALSSSDAAAQFPQSSVTYQPAVDAGAHVFTARLMTAGIQTVRATDAANGGVSCSFQVTVYAPSVHYTVTFAQDANVGVPATATVTVLSGINAVIPDYSGTVTFASSDSAAVLPANFVFNGTQGGVATVQATFNTVGSQTLVASEQGNPGVTGTGIAQVRGLVYTDPATGLGAARLVRNAASTPGVVQLDLVVTKRVRGAAGFGAGMNLPAASTAVVPDTTPILDGTTFGTGANVSKAAVQANNVLYSVMTRRNATNGTGSEVTLNAASVLYSVRLKLNPTAQAGVVFDGAALASAFRAAVRDRLGNDVIGQADFAIGKLEIK